jgi:hypothetical protein
MFQAGMIGPNEIADMLPYMDIPASVADGLGNAIRQRVQQQSQPSPQQQELEQAQKIAFGKEMDNKDADTAQKRAKAARDTADAQAVPAKLQMEGLKAAAGLQATQAEMQMHREDHHQGMVQDAQQHVQNLRQTEQQHVQRVRQSNDQHQQRQVQGAQAHAVKLSHMQQEAAARGLAKEAEQPGGEGDE